MAQVILKGMVNNPIECTNEQAKEISRLLSDKEKNWKEVRKAGYATVSISEVKYVLEDAPKELQVNDNDNLMKEYIINRNKFLSASTEDKVKWAWSQFKLMWFIFKGTVLDKEDNVEEIKEFYKPLASKFFKDHPQRTVLDIKYIFEEFEKKFCLKSYNKVDNDGKNINNDARKAALKIFEISICCDK